MTTPIVAPGAASPNTPLAGPPAARLQSPARDRLRLLAVTLAALALCAVYAWRGDVSSDFWEHAAVVRELAAHPLSPGHPLFSVHATHAYFSPYHLAVALGARLTGLPAMVALSAAGLVNLILVVLAFRLFLVRLLPRGEAAAPYALLFVFFLWGREPWMWSGFLHIGMLGYSVPYPSTFAMAAMFLSLALLLDALDRGRRRNFLGIALLVPLCVTIHPPTAIMLIVGLCAVFLARVKDEVLLNGAMLAGAVIAGAAAALAWPYFPVLRLFTEQPAEFHDWSGVFYQNVLSQIWPTLLALPVLVWRLRENRRDALVLFAVLLGLVYALGWFTGKYGLGRAIACIVILTQIALGSAMAAWEARLGSPRSWLPPACALAALLALFVYDRPPLPRLRRYRPPLWHDVQRMLAPVRPGEVVLADSRTSYMVPVLTGGHVVAWRHPVYWVPDLAERRDAQDRFFTPVTDADRRKVIGRYQVRWLLLNRQEVMLGAAEERRLAGLGCVVADRGPLVLVDLQSSCATAGS
jgi:hypothetical protein